MSNYNQNGLLVTEKQDNRKAKRFAMIGGGVATALIASSANAAIDLTKLTEQFTQLETAVSSVIAVALTIAIVVIGWRWIKRAIFSI